MKTKTKSFPLNEKKRALFYSTARALLSDSKQLDFRDNIVKGDVRL